MRRRGFSGIPAELIYYADAVDYVMKLNRVDLNLKSVSLLGFLSIPSSYITAYLCLKRIQLHKISAGASVDRSSPSDVFLRKVVLEICNKFTGEFALQIY